MAATTSEIITSRRVNPLLFSSYVIVDIAYNYPCKTYGMNPVFFVIVISPPLVVTVKVALPGLPYASKVTRGISPAEVIVKADFFTVKSTVALSSPGIGTGAVDPSPSNI